MSKQALWAVLAGIILLALPAAAGEPFDHQHTQFTKILRAYVKDGLVDYQSLSQARGPLEKYLEDLGSVSADEIVNWTLDQKLAYWLNFYNACLLDAVSRNMPLKPDEGGNVSPRQIPGLWTNYKWNTPNGKQDLNTMEFMQVRKLNNDLWIFAINRGVKGGGVQLSEAYTGDRVRGQMSQAVGFWLANPINFQASSEQHQISVSSYLHQNMKILERDYFRRGEFMGHTDYEIIAAKLYLAHGTDKQIKALLYSGDFSLQNLPFDQNLNIRSPQ